MKIDSCMWEKSVKILSRGRGDGQPDRFVISAKSFASHVEGGYINREAETAIFYLGTWNTALQYSNHVLSHVLFSEQ